MSQRLPAEMLWRPSPGGAPAGCRDALLVALLVALAVSVAAKFAFGATVPFAVAVAVLVAVVVSFPFAARGLDGCYCGLMGDLLGLCVDERSLWTILRCLVYGMLLFSLVSVGLAFVRAFPWDNNVDIASVSLTAQLRSASCRVKEGVIIGTLFGAMAGSIILNHYEDILGYYFWSLIIIVATVLSW